MQPSSGDLNGFMSQAGRGWEDVIHQKTQEILKQWQKLVYHMTVITSSSTVQKPPEDQPQKEDDNKDLGVIKIDE